jgi:hypothetical protein
VFELTPQEASMLAARARSSLDDAFAAVVVAATGRDDCPSVPTLAGPPDQPLDADTCRRLARHIGDCPICGLRANGKVATARLLHAMPVAAVPEDLRERVLATATMPEYAEMRAVIGMRSDPPRPAPQTEYDDEEPRRRAGLWVAVGAAAVGVLLLTGIFLVLSGSGGGHAPGGRAAAAPPGGSPSEEPTGSATAGPSPTRTSKSPTPTPTPTPSKKSTTPKTEHGSEAPANTAPPPRTPGRQPPTGPGTLTVTGCDMRDSGHCAVTVTAHGGSVHWAVTGTDGAIRAGGRGDLGAGEHASVTVSRTYRDLCLGEGSGSVTFSSGSSASVRWDC